MTTVDFDIYITQIIDFRLAQFSYVDNVRIRKQTGTMKLSLQRVGFRISQ